MKIIAMVCNVVFWGFFCVVLLTDGPPEDSDALFLIFPLAMPILNVLVIRFWPSPGRIVRLGALAGNTIWFGLACWLAATRYPSHPREEGLLEFTVLIALTPVLSAIALYMQLRATEPASVGPPVAS